MKNKRTKNRFRLGKEIPNRNCALTNAQLTAFKLGNFDELARLISAETISGIDPRAAIMLEVKANFQAWKTQQQTPQS